MFLKSQDSKRIEYYEGMLKTIGSLSRLFSESNEPYIQYRIAENLFCKSFNADNLSRTDCSADASKDKLGVGIKTFLEKNGATMQKVAEFNSDHQLFRNLADEEKILKVSQLRNERIEATKRIFGLDGLIYHCVTRKGNGIIVYETPMDQVEIDKIKNIDAGKNIISFEDSSNEYSFNITKSTLYKRFLTKNVLLDFPVEIMENPFDALESLFKKAEREILFAPVKTQEHIFLPLYSVKRGEKIVPEKSGLNQWNALGRPRNSNEVYIKIPSWINKAYPEFFPPRDTSFTLLLPNGLEMSAKVCQDNEKALMSNPNSALGEWLLRDVLDLKERELLTYSKLERIGLDSVVIYKTGADRYDIDFTKAGSYESFRGQNIEESEDEEA
jgi:hypothetical protein